MRALSLLAIAAITLTANAQNGSATVNGTTQAAASAAGQSAEQSAQSTGSLAASSQGANAAAQTANAGAANLAQSHAAANQASSVSAELTKNINSKNAKVGDEVVARTTSAAQLSDGTRLPKGTRLLGKVTEARAKSSSDHDSKLGFTFDRALLHDGRQIPIHTVLQSVSAPMNAAAMADMSQDSGLSAAPIAAGSSGSTRSGGLLGGTGSTLRSTGGLVSGTASNLGNSATNGVRSLGNGAVSATDNRPVSLSGSNSAGFTTSQIANLPGVMLNSSASGQNITFLSGTGKNIDLSSGTQMTLALSAEH
jgi:hypothetical protein